VVKVPATPALGFCIVFSIRTLRSWMGHRDIKSTMVYLKGVQSKDALAKVNAGSLAAYMGQRAAGNLLPFFVAIVSDDEIDIAPVLLYFAAVERYSGIVRGDRSRSHLCQRRDRVNFWNFSYIKISTSSPRTRLIFSSS
jgi:hypothetical protein